MSEEKILKCIVTIADALENLGDVGAELKKLVGEVTVNQPQPIPQLDPNQLESLPWKTYKNKEPCKPGEAGWIMRDTQGAEALADLIEKQANDVKVQIGSHRYKTRFSGDKHQFIGRAPIKETKS